MYTIRQFASALLTLQVLLVAVGQTPTYGFIIGNVTTNVDDYILENRRQYNATLQSYQDQMKIITDSLNLELSVLERQKELFLRSIQETNEKIDPLEVLGLPAKYCIQQYRQEVPYADIIKTNIESCISAARSYAYNIVSSANSYYNYLRSYYNGDLKNGLNSCAKSNTNPSLNYTLCVTSLISKTNTYTHSNRINFASAMQSARCSLESRVDTAVTCTYSQYNSILTSIGAATRLIHECLSDYLEDVNGSGNSNVSNNNTISTAGCPNVIYVEVKDSDKEARSLSNPLLGLNSTLSCVEIRFV